MFSPVAPSHGSVPPAETTADEGEDEAGETPSSAAQVETPEAPAPETPAPEAPEPEPEPEPEASKVETKAPEPEPEQSKGDHDEDDGEETFSSGPRDEANHDADDGKKKKKKKLDFKVRARVVAGVGLENEASPVDDMGEPVALPSREVLLELRQARVRFDIRYKDRLRVKVSADFADLLGSPDPGEVIRDAWGNIEVIPEFQIKVGAFKRPYSRLELRGVSKIPFIGRGLFNDVGIEDLGYGDRAVGLALWGKHEPERRGLHELKWAVSLTNNVIAGAPKGVDVHARVSYDPLKWMSIGVNGAFKYVEDALSDEELCQSEWIRAEDCRREVGGVGFDLLFETKHLYATAELNLAQDWLYADTSPWMLGALAYASYDIDVGERTRLQPTLSFEYMDHNLDFALSEAVRGVVGFNVLWTKYLRVMPQFQFVEPVGPWTSFNRFSRRWVVGTWVSVQL